MCTQRLVTLLALPVPRLLRSASWYYLVFPLNRLPSYTSWLACGTGEVSSWVSLLNVCLLLTLVALRMAPLLISLHCAWMTWTALSLGRPMAILHFVRGLNVATYLDRRLPHIR